MYNQQASSKAIGLFVLALLLVGSALAFPHSLLGAAGREPSTDTLTVAGQARQCSEYPDESGTFIGAKTIRSAELPALVNVYYVDGPGEWRFYNEYEAPVSFSGGNREYAYEIYYCPELTATCASGDQRAITESTYQVCSNGAWGATQTCSAGSYYSPSDKKCITFWGSCKEQWSCSGWGQCTANGEQYRSCSDANSCGTFKDKPSTSQSCTPQYSGDQSSTTSLAVKDIQARIKLIGNPMIDSYGGPVGESRTITQTFEVTTPGQYWIEAGIYQVRGFNIAGSIEENTCNPDEPWYANKLVTFNSAGTFDYQFKVTPLADGEYILHTAIVTGCGGDVVQQQNGEGLLVIGDNADAGKTGTSYTGLGILIGGLALLGGGVYYARKRR